jgi:hypothetical protein
VKHAGSGALDALENLLERVRAVQGLQERARGVFYRRSKAFLHFHEDKAGLFADLRVADDWERCSVNTSAQRSDLVRRLLAVIRDSDRSSASATSPRIPRSR